MASTTGNYFSRSWALVTRDKNWIRPVILLALAMFVPIAGFLGVLGYTLEWANLTARGVDSAPKQKNVNIGGCISSGWRGFVAALGWIVPYLILYCAPVISFLGGTVTYDKLVATLVTFLLVMLLVKGVVETFCYVFWLICALHATARKKIGAGYQIDRIFGMIKADFGGVARIWGLNVVMAFILMILSNIFQLIVLVPAFGQLSALASVSGTPVSSIDWFAQLISLIGIMGIPIIIATLINYAFEIIRLLVISTSVGLWMRQFDVISWGADDKSVSGSDGSASSMAALTAEKSEHAMTAGKTPLTHETTKPESSDSFTPPTASAPGENNPSVVFSEAVEGKSEESVSEDAAEPASADETAGEDKSE